ncbi:hypothetical protein [Kineosporia sp. NBRC 101731]|uniref:hypothetical protein n=1 Tax=Kineosporia sp. NBRC 101731 TaxID=3032199 RepID=UPI0024A041BE|nr:hypothetical protein [Kineosporia sp. NBRC 101731]GLY32557.1 hypothetical protein Kisp02_59220 [Kineosporia sp. NBRC 101731]
MPVTASTDFRPTVFGPWLAERRMVKTWRAVNVGVGAWFVVKAATGIPNPLGPVPTTSLMALPLCVQIRTTLRGRRRRQDWRRQARPQWTPRGAVDPEPDRLLREGLAAAFDRNYGRLGRVIDEIRTAGLDDSREVRDLLVAVTAMAFFAVSGEKWPAYAELKVATQEFLAAHPLLEIPEVHAQVFFSGLTKEQGPSGVFFGKYTLWLGFSVTAWLLQDFPRPAGLGPWQFLDEIEDALSTGDGRVARMRWV